MITYEKIIPCFSPCLSSSQLFSDSGQIKIFNCLLKVLKIIPIWFFLKIHAKIFFSKNFFTFIIRSNLRSGWFQNKSFSLLKKINNKRRSTLLSKCTLEISKFCKKFDKNFIFFEFHSFFCVKYFSISFFEIQTNKLGS